MSIKLDKYNLTEADANEILDAIKEKVISEKAELEAQKAELEAKLEESKTLIKEGVEALEEAKAEKSDDEKIAEAVNAQVKLYKEAKDKEIESFLEAEVEKFVESNKTNIVNNMKLNFAENLIEDVYEVFEKYNITFDAEKVDALEEAYAEIEVKDANNVELTAKLEEANNKIAEAEEKMKLEEKIADLDEVSKEKAIALYNESKSLDSIDVIIEAAKKPSKDDETDVDDVDLEDDDKKKKDIKEKEKNMKESKALDITVNI
jgi:Fe-S cluster assembly iron-binding protein IscA